MGVSVSSVLPFWGERIAQAFGGTSNRPMLDATRMFAPLSLAADLESTAMNILRTGDAIYPLADLTRRYIPLSGTVINRALPGEVESREASRALRLAAPVGMEKRQGGGGQTVQTPLTPIMREAVNLAMAGDSAGSEAALERAVQARVEQGLPLNEARSAVAAAFQARDPERATFGRQLTATERRRLLARMSGPQRQAYLRSRSVFDRRLLKRRTTRRRRRRTTTRL
jgi:hypothetical protein